MELKNMLYRRKSFRSYMGEKETAQTLAQIDQFVKDAQRLYPECRLEWQMIGPESIKCIQKWRSPHIIAIYAERNTQSLVNLGFVFQQVDLYLQSTGLGSCWLGLGKLSNDKGEEIRTGDGLECVMMIAFGKSAESLRNGKEDFNRKPMAEIADVADEKLEPARFAPSAVNSQPWYFVHGEDAIHVYCMERFFRKPFLGDMNKMDVGIALAHLFEANRETFRFFTAEDAPALKGNLYIGSFTL